MFKSVRIVKNYMVRSGTLAWLPRSTNNCVDAVLLGVSENIVGRKKNGRMPHDIFLIGPDKDYIPTVPDQGASPSILPSVTSRGRRLMLPLCAGATSSGSWYGAI
jgi:hypothetical protein